MTEIPARPATCKATLSPREGGEDVMVCERCGFEWPAGAAGPACDPITFETLRMRMIDEVTRAEASLSAVLGLGRKGRPTDGGAAARRRMAELAAVQRAIERVSGDAEIKKRLNAGAAGGAQAVVSAKAGTQGQGGGRA